MSNKNLFLLLISAICMLVSCGDSKKLVPEQSKITGPLGDYYEVVDREYSLIDGKISVEIKRIKDGMPTPWKEGMEVGYDDGYFEPHFTIELKDNDGNILSKDKTDIVFDREDLKTISSIGVDETASISFDAKEGASKFKIGSTFTVHNGDSKNEDNSSSIDGSHDLKGIVDKYPITMHLEIDGTNVNGSLYYDKNGPNAKLMLSGTNNDGVLDLNETEVNGKPTGHFNGKFENVIFKGQYIMSNGKSMPFAVTEGDVDDLSFDDDDSSSNSSYDDSETSSSSGSFDWDELLDSYEQYVDDYIVLLKKAKNGDLSAISEYASVLQDANELNSKIERAKSDLSSSQMERYNKISMKLAKAAQQM